jgi:hypothetical protein
VSDTRTPKTDAELKGIAEGLAAGRIFSDRHIPPNELSGFEVFLPLTMMSPDDFEKFKKMDVGMIYEYLDNAGPRSVNGFPIFLSFKTLTKDETRKVLATWKALKEATAAVQVPQ